MCEPCDGLMIIQDAMSGLALDKADPRDTPGYKEAQIMDVRRDQQLLSPEKY